MSADSSSAARGCRAAGAEGTARGILLAMPRSSCPQALYVGGLLFAGALALACEREHPVFIDPSQEEEKGRTSGEAVDAAADAAPRKPSENGDAGVDAQAAPGSPSKPAEGTAKPAKPDVNFDKGDVYVFGYLQNSLGGRERFALMNLATPDSFWVGFEAVSDRPVLREGELLYPSYHMGPAAFFGFVPDLTSRAELPPSDYPVNPTDNDRVITPTYCVPKDELEVGPHNLMLSPDGLVAYRCADGWHILSEKDYRLGPELMALGRDKLAWTQSGELVRLTYDVSYERIEVVGLPLFPVITVRAHDNGFRVAVGGDSGPELWAVSEDGTAEQIGTYPQPEADFLLDAVLTGPGDLVVRDDQLVNRLSLAGDSEVLYEDDEGFISLQRAWLVTGP